MPEGRRKWAVTQINLKGIRYKESRYIRKGRPIPDDDWPIVPDEFWDLIEKKQWGKAAALVPEHRTSYNMYTDMIWEG